MDLRDFRAPIRNYRIHEEVREVQDFTKLRVNESPTKYKFVNKLLIKVVDKLKKWGVLKYSTSFEKDIITSEIVIDYSNLYKELRDQFNYFSYRNEEIEFIIIGNKQMHQLMRCDDVQHCLRIITPTEGVPKSIAGKTLILNPYIDGIVFVPKNGMY